MKNKKLFDMDSIDIVKYSQSLGLVVAPRIRFMQKTQQAQMKKKQESAAPFSSEEESDDDDDAVEGGAKEKKPTNKKQLLLLKKMAKEKESKEKAHYNPFNADEDEDDSLFTVKQVFNPKDAVEDEDEESLNQKNKIKFKTKASVVRQINKKKFQVNEKIKFDDDGNVNTCSTFFLVCVGNSNFLFVYFFV